MAPEMSSGKGSQDQAPLAGSPVALAMTGNAWENPGVSWGAFGSSGSNRGVSGPASAAAVEGQQGLPDPRYEWDTPDGRAPEALRRLLPVFMGGTATEPVPETTPSTTMPPQEMGFQHRQEEQQRRQDQESTSSQTSQQSNSWNQGTGQLSSQRINPLGRGTGQGEGETGPRPFENKSGIHGPGKGSAGQHRHPSLRNNPDKEDNWQTTQPSFHHETSSSDFVIDTREATDVHPGWTTDAFNNMLPNEAEMNAMWNLKKREQPEASSVHTNTRGAQLRVHMTHTS